MQAYHRAEAKTHLTLDAKGLIEWSDFVLIGPEIGGSIISFGMDEHFLSTLERDDRV